VGLLEAGRRERSGGLAAGRNLKRAAVEREEEASRGELVGCWSLLWFGLVLARSLAVCSASATFPFFFHSHIMLFILPAKHYPFYQPNTLKQTIYI
jgi:hypothetical protein